MRITATAYRDRRHRDGERALTEARMDCFSLVPSSSSRTLLCCCCVCHACRFVDAVTCLSSLCLMPLEGTERMNTCKLLSFFWRSHETMISLFSSSFLFFFFLFFLFVGLRSSLVPSGLDKRGATSGGTKKSAALHENCQREEASHPMHDTTPKLEQTRGKQPLWT